MKQIAGDWPKKRTMSDRAAVNAFGPARLAGGTAIKPDGTLVRPRKR